MRQKIKLPSPFFIFLLSSAVILRPVLAAEFLNAKEEARAAFQKGKAFYDQGRYAEAFAEWEAAASILEGQPVKKTINFLKSRIDPALLVKEALPPNEVEKIPMKEAADLIDEAASAPLPKDADKVLSGANRKLEDQIRDTEGQIERLAAKAEAELVRRAKEAADEQKRTLEARVEKAQTSERAFQAGRALFEKQDYEGALKEWETILPGMPKADGIRTSLKKLSEDSKRVERMSALALQAPSAAGPMGERVEEAALEELLQNESFRLADEIRELQDKIKLGLESESRAKALQKKIDADYRKGKDHHKEGRYAKAAEAWSKLTPYLKNKSLIENMIRDIRVRERELAAIQKMPARAVQNPSADRHEKELRKMLKDGVSKTDADIPGLPKARNPVSADAGRRDPAWIRSTFEQGKAMHEMKHDREASLLWGVLQPYLADEPEMKAYIKKASKK